MKEVKNPKKPLAYYYSITLIALLLFNIFVALVKTQHEKAKKILTENRSKLDVLAQYLYEKETITGEEFMTILEREGAKA